MNFSKTSGSGIKNHGNFDKKANHVKLVQSVLAGLRQEKAVAYLP